MLIFGDQRTCSDADRDAALAVSATPETSSVLGTFETLSLQLLYYGFQFQHQRLELWFGTVFIGRSCYLCTLALKEIPS